MWQIWNMNVFQAKSQKSVILIAPFVMIFVVKAIYLDTTFL